MGKLIAVLLGIAVVGGAAYWALRDAEAPTSAAEHISEKPSDAAPSAAKQQLDNVREAAHRIEAEGQRRADEAAANTGE
ncbi:MAG: hypothetical protein IRZ16_03175 [Myxococcaceae bacterium]|nr:hypothetical protein [Myxococcaceae bacterium]